MDICSKPNRTTDFEWTDFKRIDGAIEDQAVLCDVEVDKRVLAQDSNITARPKEPLKNFRDTKLEKCTYVNLIPRE